MKLTHIVKDIQKVMSEEEFLTLENDLLREELDFQDKAHSLELIETVLNCIEKEGAISKSIEIMFGENFSDLSNAKEELKKAYDAALEALINLFPAKDLQSLDPIKAGCDVLIQKLEKLKHDAGTHVVSRLDYEFSQTEQLSEHAHRIKAALKRVNELIKGGFGDMVAKGGANDAFIEIKDILTGKTELDPAGSGYSGSESTSMIRGCNFMIDAITDLKKLATDLHQILSMLDSKVAHPQTRQLVERVLRFLIRTGFMLASKDVRMFEKGVRERIYDKKEDYKVDPDKMF